MRVAVIVQARMTSTRLPGKVLMDLAGKPLLERELERLPGEIVLAVTTNPDDDPLTELADRLGVRWYRGSEHDVLSRYAGAAREADADAIVRVTSDCPLIDRDEVHAVIDALTPDVDYAANILVRRLPRGLDTEALWRDVLDRCDRMATSTPAREHVTWHIHTEHPERFVLRSVRAPFDAADLRWTVDTEADLELVRRLYAAGMHERPLADIIAHVRAHPELAAINAHVAQKET